MSRPDDEELARLLAEAFDEEHLGPPPDHLTQAAKALGRKPVEPAPPADELAARRVHRLNRHLAPAAASASRHLGTTIENSDGTLVTEVRENEEGRLSLSIRSRDSSVLYVSFAWTPITADGVGVRSQLISPLALDRQGASVRYELGSVDGADAVDIEAAEPFPTGEVTPSHVVSAFQFVPTGSSRRAWIRAEEIHRANGDPLADSVRRELNR